MNVVLTFMIKNKLDILSENLIFMAYFLLLINNEPNSFHLLDLLYGKIIPKCFHPQNEKNKLPGQYVDDFSAMLQKYFFKLPEEIKSAKFFLLHEGQTFISSFFINFLNAPTSFDLIDEVIKK